MKRKRLIGSRRIIAVFFLSMIVGGTRVESLQAAGGTDSASFLKIPVGAGPAAMGSAYSALANDAYAPTWNPAGLGFLPSTQISAQHLSYLESIHYEHLSIVHPLSNKQSLGFAVQYLGSGDIASTDIRGNSIGDFSSHYAAYTLAYGRALTEKLSLGLSSKMIDAKISDVSAQAFAFDTGAFYKPTSALNLAAVVSNVGTKLKFLDEAGPLPLSVRLGAAARLGRAWTASAEGSFLKEEKQLSGHFGLAWRPVSIISLRTGYRTDTLKGLDALAGFSTGIGIEAWGHELSYAWVPYGELGNTQYFTLLLRFGAAEEAKRNLIQYQSIKRHQTVQKTRTTLDPEYEQLMQLLADKDEALVANWPDRLGKD